MAAPRSHKRPANQSLEDTERGLRRVEHAGHRQMEGLLEGMLPAHGGVRHLIGVDDPAGAWGKTDIALIGFGLAAVDGRFMRFFRPAQNAAPKP